jgi:rhodanese-related sulfurtransferase
MQIDEFFEREAHPVSHGNWENRWKVSITGTKVRWTVKTDVGIKDLDTEQNVTTNVFYHTAVVYTQDRMEIYIDGQSASSTTWNGYILQTSIDFMIGQVLPGNSNYNFKGIIDDVSIYNYALSSSEIEDLYDQSSSIEFSTNPDVPRNFSLSQNYPNPFNPNTVINYELPASNDVEIIVYNTLGKKVETLVAGRRQAGYHSVKWNAGGYASGIYYYKIVAGSFVDIKRMLLLK